MLGGFAVLSTCLAWGLLLKPGILTKVNLANAGNVVTKICQEMDSSGAVDELTPLEEVCLVCLTEKYMHLEHCKSSNRCIKNFHVHSSFFNKSFGDANIRPYFLFYLLSLAQCIFYLHLIGRSYWTESASELFIGKVMLMHGMMENRVLTTFLMVEFYTLIVLNRALTMLNAAGNGLTLNEYCNAQDYRYLFAADRIKKKFDEFTTKMTHRPVPCHRFFVNIIVFFFSCKRKELKQRNQDTPKSSYFLVRERQNSSAEDSMVGAQVLTTGDSGPDLGAVELR